MMKNILKSFFIIINVFRLIPHLMIIVIHEKKEIIYSDIEVWSKWKGYKHNRWYSFVKLMTVYSEFRNIYYLRIGLIQYLVKWLCPPLSTLYINCNNRGEAFRINHGFSTIITAKKIGVNFSVNQQVTIGNGNNGKPSIGDNVSIAAGAIVLGGIHIGDNSIIGAGTVITKSVDANSTVVGGPAYIVKRNGIKISKEILK